MTVLLCQNCHHLTCCISDPQSARSVASFCWGHFGRHGALTFNTLTMPTAVVHYCSSWRKSRLWAWCLLNRLYVTVTDHMMAATIMWIGRGLVYCCFFGWTSVLRWWMQDQCTLLHTSDITVLWKSGEKSEVSALVGV